MLKDENDYSSDSSDRDLSFDSINSSELEDDFKFVKLLKEAQEKHSDDEEVDEVKELNSVKNTSKQMFEKELEAIATDGADK
jgi:hypothetical protein